MIFHVYYMKSSVQWTSSQVLSFPDGRYLFKAPVSSITIQLKYSRQRVALVSLLHLYICKNTPIIIFLVVKICLKNWCHLWWTPITLTFFFFITLFGSLGFRLYLVPFQQYIHSKTFKNQHVQQYMIWMVSHMNLHLRFDYHYSCKGLFLAIIQPT